MIILIGNQKGGAGKSTLTLLLANFLTSQKNCNVTVLDMDYQQSLVEKFERAKLLENPEAYQVLAASLEKYAELHPVLNENPNDLVLIDLPGKLDDDGLIPVFQGADLVICPFSYDEFSFKSTILFAVVLNKINPELDIVFVPNRINANVRFETQAEVEEQLRKFGSVTAALSDRIDFQRVSTFATPELILPVVEPVLEQLFLTHFAFLVDDLTAAMLNDDYDEQN